METYGEKLEKDDKIKERPKNFEEAQYYDLFLNTLADIVTKEIETFMISYNKTAEKSYRKERSKNPRLPSFAPKDINTLTAKAPISEWPVSMFIGGLGEMSRIVSEALKKADAKVPGIKLSNQFDPNPAGLEQMTPSIFFKHIEQLRAGLIKSQAIPPTIEIKSSPPQV